MRRYSFSVFQYKTIRKIHISERFNEELNSKDMILQRSVQRYCVKTVKFLSRGTFDQKKTEKWCMVFPSLYKLFRSTVGSRRGWKVIVENLASASPEMFYNRIPRCFIRLSLVPSRNRLSRLTLWSNGTRISIHFVSLRTTSHSCLSQDLSLDCHLHSPEVFLPISAFHQERLRTQCHCFRQCRSSHRRQWQD